MGFFKNIKANLGAGKGMFGKEGGFGSGKGKLSQVFAPKARSGPSDYTQSQIKKTSPDGYAAIPSTHKDYGMPIEGETGMGGPGTGEGRRINTGNIDFNNTEHVKNIQQRLVEQGMLTPTFTNAEGEEVSSIDGQFGPMTEKAYRGYINERREGAGMDAYQYDNLLDNATASNQNSMPQNQAVDSAGYNEPPGPFELNNLNQVGPSNQMTLQEYQNLYPNQNYQDTYGDEFGSPTWDAGAGGYVLPQGVFDQINLKK